MDSEFSFDANGKMVTGMDLRLLTFLDEFIGEFT